MEDKRKRERRVDPNAWTPDHRSQVKLIFALAVAGFFMVNGAVIITWAVMNDEISNLVAGLGVGMIGVGFLAAFPSRTMPIISLVLKRFGFGKLEIPVADDVTMLDIVPLDTLDSLKQDDD